MYVLTLLLLSIRLCIVNTDAFQRMLSTAHNENVLTKNLYFSTNLQILILNWTNLLKHIVVNGKKNLKYFTTHAEFLIRIGGKPLIIYFINFIFEVFSCHVVLKIKHSHRLKTNRGYFNIPGRVQGSQFDSWNFGIPRYLRDLDIQGAWQ